MEATDIDIIAEFNSIHYDATVNKFPINRAMSLPNDSSVSNVEFLASLTTMEDDIEISDTDLDMLESCTSIKTSITFGGENRQQKTFYQITDVNSSTSNPNNNNNNNNNNNIDNVTGGTQVFARRNSSAELGHDQPNEQLFQRNSSINDSVQGSGSYLINVGSAGELISSSGVFPSNLLEPSSTPLSEALTQTNSLSNVSIDNKDFSQWRNMSNSSTFPPSPSPAYTPAPKIHSSSQPSFAPNPYIQLNQSSLSIDVSVLESGGLTSTSNNSFGTNNNSNHNRAGIYSSSNSDVSQPQFPPLIKSLSSPSNILGINNSNNNSFQTTTLQRFGSLSCTTGTPTSGSKTIHRSRTLSSNSYSTTSSVTSDSKKKNNCKLRIGSKIKRALSSFSFSTTSHSAANDGLSADGQSSSSPEEKDNSPEKHDINSNSDNNDDNNNYNNSKHNIRKTKKDIKLEKSSNNDDDSNDKNLLKDATDMEIQNSTTTDDLYDFTGLDDLKGKCSGQDIKVTFHIQPTGSKENDQFFAASFEVLAASTQNISGDWVLHVELMEHIQFLDSTNSRLSKSNGGKSGKNCYEIRSLEREDIPKGQIKIIYLSGKSENNTK
eukprot:Awhi_evm1s13108